MRCEICDAEFVPTRRGQRYCPDCGKAPRRARARYDRAVRKNKQHAGPPEPTPRECKQCGKTFLFVGTQWYCSDACRRQHAAEHAVCEGCGVKLLECGIRIETAGGRHYCSDACREAARRARAVAAGNVKKCAHCGREFIQTNGHATFCSRECYRQAVTDGWRPPRSEQTTLEPTMQVWRCEQCGKLFNRVYGDITARYCSADCAQTARQAAKKKLADAKSAKGSFKSLCAGCRVLYADCPWMTTGRVKYPDNAIVKSGEVVSCPLYDAREKRKGSRQT